MKNVGREGFRFGFCFCLVPIDDGVLVWVPVVLCWPWADQLLENLLNWSDPDLSRFPTVCEEQWVTVSGAGEELEAAVAALGSLSALLPVMDADPHSACVVWDTAAMPRATVCWGSIRAVLRV